MWLTLSVIVVPIAAVALWFIRSRRRISRSQRESSPRRGIGELVRREEELKEGR
jgi:hypothetical protein